MYYDMKYLSNPSKQNRTYHDLISDYKIKTRRRIWNRGTD